MLVLMNETRRCSDDAYTVRQLEKGQMYDVAHTNGCYLINKGWASEVDEDSIMGSMFKIKMLADETYGESKLKAINEVSKGIL